MNTKNQDQLIYDKARMKVNRRNSLFLIFMSIYSLTLFIVYQLNFLTSSLVNFKTIYLACAISQICLFGMIFILLSNGKRIFRIFYWLGYLYSFVLLYVPIYFFMHDYFHFITYTTWIIAFVILLMIEKKFGKSLKTNKWCKIYYDLEIEIEEGQSEGDIEEIYLDNYEPNIDFDQLPEKKEYTLPEISVRLGICIYASLMIFPILLQIFSRFFSSIDLQTVFATKDVFIFCIFTALIWTLPVFFFYYNHPLSRKITIGCISAEIIRIVIYLKTFIEYITSHTYPNRVFILFIFVETIRYGVLLFSLLPIFKIEMPDELENDDDEYE